MVSFKKPAAKTTSLKDQAKRTEPKAADSAVSDQQLQQLFVTSPDDINRQYEKQKEMREARKSTNNLQIFRIKDGEEKKVWFPQKSPWMGANLHYVYVGGRTYHLVCTAAIGDCPMCDAGNRARFFAIYDIVDCTGYKINSGPNAGTEVKDFHCYYVASDARNTGITKMFKRVADEDVPNCLVSLERAGSGANTTHIFGIDDDEFVPPQKYVDESPDFEKVAEDWSPPEKGFMEEVANQWASTQRDS